MLSTEFVAWWGGIISTGVLVWDIFKWRRSGPRLRVEAFAGMVEVGSRQDPKHSFVLIKVTNIGDRATTLINCTGAWYPNWMSFKLRRCGSYFMVANPGTWSLPLPHELASGNLWTGGVDEDELRRNDWDKAGYLVVGVSHACSGKPAVARVHMNRQIDRKAPK